MGRSFRCNTITSDWDLLMMIKLRRGWSFRNEDWNLGQRSLFTGVNLFPYCKLHSGQLAGEPHIQRLYQFLKKSTTGTAEYDDWLLSVFTGVISGNQWVHTDWPRDKMTKGVCAATQRWNGSSTLWTEGTELEWFSRGMAEKVGGISGCEDQKVHSAHPKITGAKSDFVNIQYPAIDQAWG